MTQHGFAVRLDWPAPGPAAAQHELTQFTPSLRRALRRAESTRRFWASGPLRPLAVTVVPIGRAAFDGHRRDCAALDCPTAAPLLGMAADAPTLPAPR